MTNGPRVIGRDELERLIAGGDPVVLVEALGPAFYADAHLPGAINIPPDRVNRLAPSRLPDIDALVVVYCSGTCTNSTSAAEALVRLGYSRVAVYVGGKEEWIEAGLPVEREPMP